MLVLKRKTLEAAIAKLMLARAEVVRSDERSAQVTRENIKKNIGNVLQKYLDNLDNVTTNVAAARKSALKLGKVLASAPTAEAADQFNSLSTEFGESRWNLGIRGKLDFDDARAKYPQDESLRTLTGILSLFDGDELELSNTLAEKFLGKTDILGLLG